MLEGVNVVLGVTGSIAAVKTVELAHELRRQGASVRAVTTPAAEWIIHPWSLEYATDNPVVTEITGGIEHVDLCGRDGWGDVFLVAPATANTAGKMAAAIDDTPVTTCATTALGAGMPVVVAPAMHEPMYDHPGVLDALDRLESWDVAFADPRIEEGKAKIATEDAIVTEVVRAATEERLADEHVVVTAGATVESIDPIRTLSNRASGRTGLEVARACYARGATVTLVWGGPTPGGVDQSPAAVAPWASVEHVESVAEMLDAVLAHAADADALVSAAAISDYTLDQSPEKIRSGQDGLTLELEPTPKLIDTVRDDHPGLTIVGFKAESEGDEDDIVAKARELRERAELSFVVGNDASVMGSDRTRAFIVRADEHDTVEGTKTALGARVADELAADLG
jgi:phosphopantothenoylcysteine decarboxylase/phosphopantothenate--cysteine ligase